MSPNVRITDRGADRTLGGWKFDSKFNVASSLHRRHRLLRLARPAQRHPGHRCRGRLFASLALDGRTADAPDSDDGGVPGWLLLGAGVLLGMGLTMVLVWRLRHHGRRRGGRIHPGLTPSGEVGAVNRCQPSDGAANLLLPCVRTLETSFALKVSALG